MGSGSGSGVLKADTFVTRSGRLKVFKLVATVLTAFTGLAFAVWIEAVARWTELNAWILGGIADFGGAIIRETLGKSAALQVRAFEQAATEAVLLGPFRPWLFTLEALIVTTIFAIGLRVVIS